MAAVSERDTRAGVIGAGRGLGPVVLFFVLAYALSWSWAVPLAVQHLEVRRGQGWPTHYPSLMGPLVAAVIVTALTVGRAGLRDLVSRGVRWRVPVRWWLVAVSPAAFLLLALAGLRLTGRDLPQSADFGRFSGTPLIGLVGVFLAITLVGSLGEEVGWRGYALPQLQRRFTPLTATLILAPLWFAWHAPQFWVIQSYREFGPADYVGMFLGLSCGAVVLTWLYNRSGGSLLLVILWHGVYNFVGATEAAATTPIAAIISTLIMVQGITLILLELWARHGRRPSILGPEVAPKPLVAPAAPETPVVTPSRAGTPSRAVTPSRVVGLALIGVVLAGFAYLRWAPGPGPVTVPAGAKAGDLRLQPCTYRTEAGEVRADCGTLVVPESREASSSRLIAVPVVRIPARSGGSAEPVFWLEGGPGQSNLSFTQASRFAQTRDVVLVGYRGIDGSVRLDCPEVASALRQSDRYLTEDSYRRYGDGFRACAKRLSDTGVDLTGYGLVQQVDDLEAARQALGYGPIDLLSQSAGTRTAMIYAWRHPGSIHRSVMLGVNPPGHFLESPEYTDELIGRYAQLCAQDSTCRGRTSDLAASIRRASSDMPDRWLFLPVKQANARIVSFYGLMESTPDLLGAPATIDALLSVTEGDNSGMWFATVFSDLLFPDLFVWGQYAAGAGLDDDAARQYFAGWGADRAVNLGAAATAFAWGGGHLADAWPTPAGATDYGTVQTSTVETLLISGALDVATPPQPATRELLPSLPNGHQVILDGFGHVGSFWTLQPEAGTRLITTFLDTGGVDQSLFAPHRVTFFPQVTATTMAKRVLALMVAVGLLTIASLTWMARRVRRRGAFGPVTSTLLRSLFPIVLGVGGWFVGALFVLTFLGGVTLDNQLLAVTAVGLPVGLGIVLAWVPRDRPARDQRIWMATAVLAGLAGAWIGYNATPGLFGVLTANVGAIAVTNLALIIGDIRQAQVTRAQVPTEAMVG